MNNFDFQVEIIGQFALETYEATNTEIGVHKSFLDYLQKHDSVVQSCMQVLENKVLEATISKEGVKDAYFDLCRLLEIDPYLDYEDEEDFYASEGTTLEEDWSN